MKLKEMKSKNITPNITEGEVVVIIKYQDKTYGNAFKFNDPKLGALLKAKIEATQRVLL